MGKKIIHVIISPFKWDLGSVKYRRHRLAEYIKGQKHTEKIFWVHPLTLKPRQFFNGIKQLKKGFIDYDLKSCHCAFLEFIPGRYQRCYPLIQGHFIKKLQRELSNFKGKKFLWFTFPGYPYLIDIIKWDKIIYDCSDLWRELKSEKDTFFSRSSRNLLKKSEEEILSRSDLVFTSSDYLKEVINRETNKNVIVVENGVDLELFNNISFLEDIDPLNNIPRPRLGFVGGMKPKINFSLLSKLAIQNPNQSIVLIGPGTSSNPEFERLLSHNNVYWLGGVAPEEVPNYMRSLDVGLLPYKEIKYNRAVFPLKFFEYLAVGLPVVGCGLPSTTKYQNDKIYVHTDTEGFINACNEVLTWNSDVDAIKKRVNLAKEADWNKKLEYIYNTVYTSL